MLLAASPAPQFTVHDTGPVTLVTSLPQVLFACAYFTDGMMYVSVAPVKIAKPPASMRRWNWPGPLRALTVYDAGSATHGTPLPRMPPSCASVTQNIMQEWLAREHASALSEHGEVWSLADYPAA